MELVEAAAIIKLASGLATLGRFYVLPVHTRMTRPGVAQGSGHAVQSICRQLCALAV